MIGLGNDKPASPRTLEETAAYWAMRLNSPTCGPADRAAFETWRRGQPAHAEAYARAERALAVVDRHLSSPELLALGDEVLRDTQRPPRRMLPAAAAGIAAALTLVIGAVVYVNLAGDGQAPPVAAVEAYETAIGERSTASLPDGSSVVLNTDSRLEVHYSPEVRRLVLVKGQVLFEVAKAPDWPFEVLAGDRRIRALGTAFDVRMDADLGVQVTLIEGRVSVHDVTTGNVVDTAEPERNELAAGEQLIARANEPTIVAAVAVTDIERVTSWRDGRLVFRDDSLTDAVKEVNRYSTTQLLVNDDPRLDEIRVSGVFKAGRTESFILAIESVHPVRAKRVEEDRIVILWQE